MKSLTRNTNILRDFVVKMTLTGSLSTSLLAPHLQGMGGGGGNSCQDFLFLTENLAQILFYAKVGNGLKISGRYAIHHLRPGAMKTTIGMEKDEVKKNRLFALMEF